MVNSCQMLLIIITYTVNVVKCCQMVLDIVKCC